MKSARPFLLLSFVALATAVTQAGLTPSPNDLRYEQRIGAGLPLDEPVTDETGVARPLGAYFGKKPAVLVFGYFNCPQLCGVVENGLVESLRPISPSVGREFQVISISIDPRDTPVDAARRRDRDVGRYGRTGAESGWHFLTGSETALRRIAGAAGFRYVHDPGTRQYAHASGFLVVTPQGVVSRYFLGVDFSPAEVASAVRRAADGKTGDSVYDLLLLCFHGAGVTGKYGKLIWRTLEVAVALTVLALAGGVGGMLYQERRRSVLHNPEALP